MAKYKNKYRIESTRLQNWDYSTNGTYFITICTNQRHYFFGEIINQKIILSDIGKLAEQYWREIPNHFKNIELGEFIIMPNHIHGIIIINSIKNTVQTGHCPVSTNNNNKTIGQKRFQNIGKNSISSIIGSFKSVTTKNARKINPDFAWQPLFWDSIIRDKQGLINVTKYIKNNPKKWSLDEHNKKKTQNENRLFNYRVRNGRFNLRH